ncbi:MerC family mercury resistance protein [Flavobacterium sp.]|jgi:hypothetical protein|uniref:MerC family mercury resistance protein n=1 Tax=Flavobacterium sp. TaxID=239 RepID=UPI0022C2D6B0|nr:MerC family mercury resistance protein [Flavobacterium sp.]MCZ8145919.1 hypothetical protein [Flavobacterium sp.]MCZ8366776.1 hypothetical protein [Flavobacterium sp.]
MNWKSLTSTDAFGVYSAGLCMIHCLVFPLITLLPLENTHNFWVDAILGGSSIGLAIKAMKKSTLVSVRLLFLVSILLLLFGLILEGITLHHAQGLLWGGGGLIIAHSIHFKTHKHE